MANLNALIAQGAQFNLPNPVDQYSKVMQLQAAQEQMQMNRQQAQQIQEDRAGFAKLRETLAGKNLTPEDYEIALTQSPDPSHQKLGIEMRFKRMRLEDLDKEMGGGVKPAAEAPMAAPVEAPMAAPAVVAFGVPYNSFGQTGKYRYDKNLSAANIFELQKKSKQGSIELEPNQYWSQDQNGQLIVKAVPPVVDNALAAQVAPGAPVVNALVAQPAVSNAMAAKQAQIAEINRKLDVLNSPKYSDLPGAKGRIDTLERQLKQLTESPVGKVDLDKFDPASVAKFLDSGNFADLKRIETATGGRYLSLGAGRALDQETGKIISEDKIPAAAAPKIYNLRTGPHTLNENGELVPVPVQGGVLPTPVAAVQPQAVAAPRIINYKGVPYTFNFETGRLEPVPVEGGVSTAAAAQPPAATGVKPDIRIIKGIPYTFNADSGKFVRVPVEGGLPAAAGKGRTLPSTDAGGGVKPAAEIKPLTEAQVIKRRDTVGKEFKTAVSALQTTQDVLDSIAFVKAEPGLARATGFTGTMLPSFPEGAAASADVRLANVKGKITALGKAAAAASGAIGSIATVEWKILSDQIAAIDPVKGIGPLLAQLDLVEQQAQGAISRIRDGYERQFGEDFERFPQFSNLPPPKSAVKPKTPEAPAPASAAGAGGFKYLGKEKP